MNAVTNNTNHFLIKLGELLGAVIVGVIKLYFLIIIEAIKNPVPVEEEKQRHEDYHSHHGLIDPMHLHINERFTK